MDKEIKNLVNDISKDLKAIKVITIKEKKVRVPDHERRLEAIIKVFRLKGYLVD